MQVIVNGKPMDMEKGQKLDGLIRTLGLDPGVLVAELNGEIVPREEYPNRALAPGDMLELVRLVGGG
jgi:sulfur carrier protein